MHRPLEDGDQLVNGAGYVHLAAPVVMKPYLIRCQNSRVGLYLDEQVASSPSGRLTYQEVADACAQWSQRVNATAEILRRAHKLALVLVRACKFSHN